MIPINKLTKICIKVSNLMLILIPLLACLLVCISLLPFIAGQSSNASEHILSEYARLKDIKSILYDLMLFCMAVSAFTYTPSAKKTAAKKRKDKCAKPAGAAAHITVSDMQPDNRTPLPCPETKQTKLSSRFLRLALYALLLFAYFGFLHPSVVLTGSMQPCIKPPSLCLTAPICKTVGYIPKRTDVVMVKISENQSQDLKTPTSVLLCKRVIGLAGEKVEIRDGIVFIDDKALQEDYLPPDYIPAGNFGPYAVPENCMFLLGDNRNMSFDSRYLKEPFFTYDSLDSVVWAVIGRNPRLLKGEFCRG